MSRKTSIVLNVKPAYARYGGDPAGDELKYRVLKQFTTSNRSHQPLIFSGRGNTRRIIAGAEDTLTAEMESKRADRLHLFLSRSAARPTHTGGLQIIEALLYDGGSRLFNHSKAAIAKCVDAADIEAGEGYVLAGADNRPWYGLVGLGQNLVLTTYSRNLGPAIVAADQLSAFSRMPKIMHILGRTR